MNKKTIWITGGSTGIGKALAIKFAKKGWNVAISARRENLLKETCGEHENIPRHARAFGNVLLLKQEVYKERVNSLKSFKIAVENETFPKEKELININQIELEKFKDLIS